MKEFCLSTVIYPGAEKYFDNFLEGVHSIPEIENASVVVIRQADVELPDFKKEIDIKVFEIGGAVGIPEVRAFMFKTLKTLPEHQYYVFSDIDDRLLPDSFKRHKDALGKADFSYGDIRLYYEDLKTPYNKNLFEISDIPPRLEDLNDILLGHITGLSAMAMTKIAIDSVPETFPNDIVFVDYWLACSLLYSGLTGARAQEVLDYRLNKSSYSALKPSDNVDVLDDRINEVLKILEYFKAHKGVEQSLKTLQHLRCCLQNDPQSVLFALKEIVPDWILWCEDVFALANHFKEENVS